MTDIMETFRATAEKQAGEMPESLAGTVAKAVREVVGTLKDNGAEISLDVRPGSQGCPPTALRAEYGISVNGTIEFDGQSLLFTAGYDKRDCYIRLHAGDRIAASVMLAVDHRKEKDKWTAAYAESPDIKFAFAAALAKAHAEGAYLNQFDIADTSIDKRIEVSAPLKLKKPVASA